MRDVDGLAVVLAGAAAGYGGDRRRPVTGVLCAADEALAELMRHAEARAESLDPRPRDRRTPAQQRAAQRAARLQELTDPFGESASPYGESASLGSFEVVDVRLTAGVMDGGGSGWLAYGTLAR